MFSCTHDFSTFRSRFIGEVFFFVEVHVFTANLHVKTGFVRRLFLKALRLHVSGRVDKQGFKAVRLYGNVGIYSEFASSV